MSRYFTSNKFVSLSIRLLNSLHEVRVGSGEQDEIRIQLAGISPQHGFFWLTGSGWVYMDHASQHGTTLKRGEKTRKLKYSEAVNLKDRDILELEMGYLNNSGEPEDRLAYSLEFRTSDPTKETSQAA